MPGSAYLQQVRRIAPPDPPGLLGREAELAELAGFCLDDGRGPYVWWQAGPWAGKSALLSTFVLRPPPEVAERVRIVSFFITARLAAQDTREAFTQVLLEQLADLTGQDLPAVLPEATREAYLLDLLAQAAGACQQAGGRLVLVVDGLDEDRGVTTGPHAHSIAGLLPADPPAGMRVIVAGRPEPAGPRRRARLAPAARSRRSSARCAARRTRGMSQRLGRQELQRLLRGSPAEQDLLGLLTAARGGLSGPDLAELTGDPAVGDRRDPAHHGGADVHPPAQPLGAWRPARRCTCWAMRNSRPPPAATSAAGWPATVTGCTPGPRPTGPGAGRLTPRSTCWAATSGSWTTLGDLPRMIALRQRPGPA